MPPVTVTTATNADLDDLTGVAATTFPLACPPSVAPGDIAEFIATNLSRQHFATYLTDPDRIVLAAWDVQQIVGYAMLVRSTVDDRQTDAVIDSRHLLELSKFYVLEPHHGAGVSSVLMTAAAHHAREAGADCLWLGVNQKNRRAQRFYGKHGFTVVGTRRFALGDHFEDDFVMVRRL